MSRKRLSKKQLRSDRFVRQTFDWAHWAETHARQLIAGVVLLGVLVAGFFVYRNMSAAAEEEAAADYMDARQAYLTGNYPLAVSDLEGFLAEHAGSDYEDDARLSLADAHFRAGQPAEAAATLERFLERHDDSPLTDNALWLLAAAYQEMGQHDRAIQAYGRALERAEYDALEVEIRQSLARTYEMLNQTERAAEQYRAIVELVPETEVAEEARRELAELTVEPLGGVPPQDAAGASDAPGTDPATVDAAAGTSGS